MTPKMRRALAMIREHGDTYKDDPNRYAVVTSSDTHLSSGQPWIHWRTAFALRDAGLVEIDGWGEETEIILRPPPGDCCDGRCA